MMNRLINVFVLKGMLMCLLMPGLWAQQGLVVLPFEMVGNHIFLQLSINGKGPLNFVFDTGASSTVIHQATAARLGLPDDLYSMAVGTSGEVPVTLSMDNEVQLGELHLSGVQLVKTPLDHLGRYIGRHIDGIIGYELLRRYILRLDFDRQQIEVFTGGEYLPEPEAEVLEFELSRKIPVIYAELSLNERETVEGRFMLDTGAGAALILNSPFVQRLQLIQRTQPRYLQRSFGLSNQYMESYMGRMAGIGLGSYYFSALPTKLSMAFQGVESLEEIDGIIGNELLKKFNLTFDYRDQLIFIHPSRYFDEPLRVDCSGLKLQYDSTFTAIEVLDVIAASPAGEAGLRPGDVLRELNGQPVQQLALEAILDYLRREGEEVEVRIERQGKILTKRFTLKALI